MKIINFNTSYILPKLWFASKAASSNTKTTNVQPKYRGMKKYDGETINHGSILFIGAKIKTGKNTFYGKTFCIHAAIDGIVRYTSFRKNNRKVVFANVVAK